MGVANGKPKKGRRRRAYCRVCNATDTQIRRAVEKCLDFDETAGGPDLATIIGGHIIAFKRVRDWLGKGQ